MLLVVMNEQLLSNHQVSIENILDAGWKPADLVRVVKANRYISMQKLVYTIDPKELHEAGTIFFKVFCRTPLAYGAL